MSFFFHTNGFRSINFTLYKNEIKQLRQEWKTFYNSIPEYPEDKFEGKGIVMCAGKVSYFTCCWISIHVLRKHKCSLPIEVWYVDNELSTEVQSALARLNVVCRNVSNYTTETVVKWALKPFSIIHSHFREILFLDADNICIKNPNHLFSMDKYKTFGTVFWPDFWKTEPQNPIWEIINVKPNDLQEQESGQILVDKKRCWKELNLSFYFNQREVPYNQLLLGDKDTFRFAWLALNTPFYMITKDAAICGYKDVESSNFCGMTIVQCVDNIPFFLHRNLLKWDVTLTEERIWQRIKQFPPNAKEKEYIIFRQNSGQICMDLRGEIEETPCPTYITELENLCIKFLSAFRRSSLYRDFLNFRYLIENRHKNIND